MFEEKTLIIFLIYLFSIKKCLVVCDIEVDSAKIMFFYGPTNNDYQQFNLDDADSLLRHPKFIHKKTIIFMPGYRNKKQNPSSRLLVNSYMIRNSTNFLNINWEELSKGSYISAQRNVLRLSPRVADFIIKLYTTGLEEDSLNLLGNSMGGRGVAVIARDVIERSNGTKILSRITSLDPSNEEAHEEFILPPIKKSFAKFVDIIHTDAGGIGTKKSMGHADFWINNGTAPQPGCPDTNIKKLCSHRKATAYWAEGVANGDSKSMLAFPLESYMEFLKNGPDNVKDSGVLMGIDCPSSARGDYYLQFNTTYGDFYSLL